jgi:hypothetical protein
VEVAEVAAGSEVEADVVAAALAGG